MRALASLAIALAVLVAGPVAQPAQDPAAANAASRTLTLPAATYPAVVRAMKDPQQALALLDRELAAPRDAPPVEGLVLRAHLLAAAGRTSESTAAWDDVARRDADLATFAARSAIAALVTGRDPDGAASRVRSLTTNAAGSPVTVTSAEVDLLLLTVAETYQAGERVDAAAPIYREVLSRQAQSAAADRARLGLAACEEAAGRLAPALDLLHEATISWRTSATYSAARTAERRVTARLQREPAAYSSEEYYAIASRLTANSHYDDAMALIEEGRTRGVVAADERFETTLIENLYRGRHNQAAMDRADRFLRAFPASRLATGVRLTQLRLAVRTGQLAAARKRLAALQSSGRSPSPEWLSGARLVAAELVGTGSAREGLALFRRVMAATRARSDRYDLSWRAGIAALRSGDAAGATALFTQARRLAPAGATPRSTVYWLAAARERAGNKAAARELWEQLVKESAYDYYGLRAAERLQRPAAKAPAASQAFPALELSAAAVDAPAFRSALTLARAGLTEAAASLLRPLAARLRGDDALALLAARAAFAAEDYASAWSLTVTRFPEFLARPATGVPDDIWHMAFPRAYWTEVAAAATRNRVDPLLLLSLMRRESRFVAVARSRTGAMGLFQIMPYTARDLMGGTDSPAGASTLVEPASADLAARLVRRIMDAFADAVAPVVASYNAGEDRVEDWWRGAKGQAEDIFVDSIPYGETRQYVREVLANYATYQRLYR